MKHQNRLTLITTLPTAALSTALAVVNQHPEQAVVVAAVAALSLYIRIRYQAPISHNRTKRLLVAAAANPELSFAEVLAAKGLPGSDPEIAEAEVRARLRDIAEAIDPAVVEPLYRVIQARLAGRLTRDEAGGAASLFRALDGEGLQHFRQFLSEALAAVADESLQLKVRVDDDLVTPLAVCVLRDDQLLALTFFASSRRLFKQLRDSGLATEETNSTFGRTLIFDGSVDTRPLEGITIERPTAAALSRLVA